MGIADIEGDYLAKLGDVCSVSEEPSRFIAPHGIALNSKGDIFVGEVSWTNTGSNSTRPASRLAAEAREVVADLKRVETSA